MFNLVTDALVLRRINYRDYDRMLTLLTPDHGRIDAVAYGCKRAKSQLVNASEVFCAGEYTLKQRSGRYTVEQCQIHQNFFALREDYDKLTCGVYMLHQLAIASLPEQADGALFNLALAALSHLCFSDLPDALVAFAFEAHYQEALGQSPRMDGCVLCGRLDFEEGFFDAALGGVICPTCKTSQPRLSPGARRILHRTARCPFGSATLLADRPEWREAALMMRKFTAFRTEPPPKTWPPV